MSERTAEAATTVEEDGIRVDKSFSDDEFPVPAIRYALESTREDAVRVRIVDTIPESFPMDRVGFHPEYESENWTAYKDHRVEFERVLDPGETVETVFGIRSDDPDLDGFMATPIIEHVPVGEEIEDVLGTGETDAVREVLSGDRATLPGMEEPVDTPPEEPVEEPPEEPVPEAKGSSPTPRSVDDETHAAVTRRDVEQEEPAEHSMDEEPVDEDPADDEELDEAEDVEDVEETDEPDEADTDEPTEGETEEEPVAEPEPEATPPEPATGSISAALAAEIREGSVEEEDLQLLRSELDLNVPRSVDVRISRLQSSVADIEAYADALAEFIDDEGTARDVLEGLTSRVEEVESELTAVTEGMETAASEREDTIADVEELHTSVDALEASVDSIGGTVASVDSRVETVESEVQSVSDDVEAAYEDLTDVTDRVAGVEDGVETVESQLEGVESTVGSMRSDVDEMGADLTAVSETVEDVDDDIETLYEGVDDVDAAVSGMEGRLDGMKERVNRFDEEFNDVWDDMAEVDTRLTDVEDRLGDDVADVEAEIQEIHDHLEQLEAFRKRLNEAFGP